MNFKLKTGSPAMSEHRFSTMHLNRTALSLAAAGVLGFLSGTAAAADLLTHIPEGTAVNTKQVLSAPGAGDTHRLLNEGRLEPAAGMPAELLIEGSGAGRFTIDNAGYFGGLIDFSAATGGVVFNQTGSEPGASGWWLTYNWWEGGNDHIVNRFSSGDDVMNVREESTAFIQGLLDFGAGQDVLNNEGTVNVERLQGLETINNAGVVLVRAISDLETLSNTGIFSIGEIVTLDSLNHVANAGVFRIEDSVDAGPASLTAPNLDTFVNEGTIDLHNSHPSTSFTEFSNRLMLPGVEFVAGAGSRMEINAFFGDVAQPTCEMSTVGQADCMSLTGGSVTGVTRIWVDARMPDKGVSFHREGMVVVDAAGTQTDGTNFVLDETSPGFEAGALFGGGIRADEMFTVHLLYDAPTQTYRLMAMPDPLVGMLGVLPLAGQSLWRSAESTSLARQTELRHGRSGGGVWAKASESDTEHDATVSATLLSDAISMPVGYEHKDRSVSLGVDGTMEGDAWRYVMGISLGTLTSNLSIEEGGARGSLDATSVAVYGSFQRGGMFVDFSGSGYAGDLDGTIALSQNPYGMQATMDAFGGRLESGYRLQLGEALAVEPLLSVVYVRSGVGAVQHLSGNKINGVVFDSAQSLRGGLGARLDFDRTLESELRVTAAVSARAWEEFDGDVDANLRTLRDPFPFATGLDGSFTELDFMVGLGRGAGQIFVSYGGQFGDDYERKTASAGFRYSW